MDQISEIRMAKMKKARDIKVGDALVKVFNGRVMYSVVTSIEKITNRREAERIRINYGGFAIVIPDTELEIR